MVPQLLGILGTSLLDALGTKLGSLPFLGVFDTQRSQTQAGIEDALKRSSQLLSAGMYSPAGYTGPAAAAMAQLALAQPDVSADALMTAAGLRGEASRLRDLSTESSRRAMSALRGTASELARQVRSIGAAGGSAAALSAALRESTEQMGRQIGQLQQSAFQSAAEAAARAGQLQAAGQQVLDENRRTVFQTRKAPYLVQVSEAPMGLAQRLGEYYGSQVGINNPFGLLTQHLANIFGYRSMLQEMSDRWGNMEPQHGGFEVRHQPWQRRNLNVNGLGWRSDNIG